MLRIFLCLLCLGSFRASFAAWSKFDSPNFLTKQNPKITKIGDRLQFLPLAVSLGCIVYQQDFSWQNFSAIGYLANRGEARNHGLSQLVLTTWAALGTMEILKYVVRRAKPSQKDHKIEYGNSFPSGHTTIAMAPAFFIANRYGWFEAIPVLAVATFVGYSRIQAKAHYITDVVGATAISFFYAKLFTFKRSIDDLQVNLVPVVRSKHGIGVQFTVHM